MLWRRPGSSLAALLAALLLTSGAGAGSPRSGFDGDSKPIRGKVRDRVEGSSWRPGCPVGLRKLRVLELRHWGFDGEPHRGRLIVHRNHDREVLSVFRRLYRARFPIRRVELIDRYGADDRRSMAADNTSGFNCRFVAGTTRWSQHAYGRAIDVNPIENPYVSSSGRVAHRASRPYVDRTLIRPGMAHRGGTLVRAFTAIGWGWGGTWSGVKDYQHFSSNGR